MDVAALGYKIEYAQVDAATKSLNAMIAAAERAEKASGGLLTVTKPVSRELNNEAQAAEKAARETSTLAAATSSASKAMPSLTQAASAVTHANDNLRKSATNSAFAVRNMSYQLVDVTQGLLTGQPVFMIAAQQLGQIGQIAAFSGMSLKQWAIEFGILFGVLQRVPAVNAEVAASNVAVASTATAAAAANQVMAATATEAATAEAIALAPLAPVIAAVAAALAVLGAGFFSLKSAANDAADNKEFLKSLGLTKKQIDGIKDSGVSAGDVFRGLGTTIGDLWKAFDAGGKITSALGAAFDWVGDKVGNVVHAVLKGAEYSVAAAIGLGRAFIATWGAIPGALGDIVISVVNYTLIQVQGMINAVIAGVNSLLQMAHLDGMFNFSNVNLGQVKNPFAGQAAKWGADLGIEFVTGFRKSIAALDGSVGNVVDANHNRLKKKYGDLAREASSVANMSTPEAKDDAIANILKWHVKDEVLGNYADQKISPIDELMKNITNLPKLLTPVQDAFESFGQAIGRSLGYAIANSRDLGDAVAQVFRQMEAEYIANKISQIFSMIGKAFGTAGNDNPIINEISSFFTGQPTLNAKGGVYSSPSLSAFSGGIYTSPQTFAFAKGAGIFAEAGPEAIMPLSRGSDGKLGVKASMDSQGFDMSKAVATLADALTSHITKTSAAVSGRAVYKYDRALPVRLGSVSRLGT